jgi:CDP-diacylglycerol---serine O-phosphatidyltransferase
MNDLDEPAQVPRFKRVPVRYLLPNIVTLLALCIGITAIRFAFEARFELAVSLIISAMILDAMDGRLARYLQGTSRFGAELDSLADFVNFGVAPAIILYVWSLNSLKTLGWVICLTLAIACALRLARFNVMLDDPNKPAWMANYFSGVPSPAGAAIAMVPLYLGFLGFVEPTKDYARFFAPLVFAVAVLMISNVPTYSGKSVTRVPREYVVPILAGAALFIVCLISFPWETLMLVICAYAAMIPLSVKSFYAQRRADRMNSKSVTLPEQTQRPVSDSD